MMIYSNKIIFFAVILIFTIISFQFFKEDKNFEIFIDKSVPYIGTMHPMELGFDGTGIKIAVIDTGVDYNHPDLFGFGKDGKVIGGYDFVDNDNSPIDTNGHGTEVAGIIAADGQLQGVAPKSKILAYRVSENGESVSSDLIIKAIEQAILDEADIINISLGVNLTNKKIDNTVNKAVEQGIIVVAAAGNNGPDLGTIGSPGINPNTITVGATYNNITASLVSTLEVEGKKYQVLPMVGTSPLDKPITAEIHFGQYGRERDLVDSEIKDSILLVERGSDLEGEIVYFSDKENNAAKFGAKAIIVYNNEHGLFFVELTHELAGPDYQPTIPAISMSGEEGLILKKFIQNKTSGTLNVFYHPDFVAHFSSRGPVSPFYIKPDLVAPGAFVNTTLIDGKYNFTSGTSFAAPHVSGAAALLLEKYPSIHNYEIKSLLLTTTEPVSDAYGQEFSLNDSGSGRLNIAKAFQAKLIIAPPNFVINLSSDNPTAQKQLELKLLEGTLENLEVKFEGPEFIQFAHILEGNNLLIKIKILGQNYGEHEGKIIVNHDEIKYVIPFLIHYTEGSISVINSKDGKTETITATPERDASIRVNEDGEYWIDTKIKVDGKTFDAYNTIEVNSINEDQNEFELLDIPEKQIVIVSGIAIIVGIVGVIAIRKTSAD